MEPRRPDHTTTSRKRATPQSASQRRPRPKNFTMSERVIEVAHKGEVEFEAPSDSRMILLFLDTENIDGSDQRAPFGKEIVDLAAGERRTLSADCCKKGKEYRYAVYLVDHDDLADGNSPPRISIATI